MVETEGSAREDGGSGIVVKENQSKSSSSMEYKKKKLHLHRYRSSFFKPLYEIFICYGHEEFIDCKESEEDDLNFASIIDKLNRQKLTQESGGGEHDAEELASDEQASEEEQMIEIASHEGQLATTEDLIQMRKARR